ncbi:MAG: hypothetical protein K2G90_00755 [Muribaculaceae bacterium]|nr:hypothetical protein [Muribaculaceae bacterium]
MIRISVYQGKKKMYGRMFENASEASGYILGTLDAIGNNENVRYGLPYTIEEIGSKVGTLLQDGSQEARFKTANDSEFVVIVYNTDYIYQDPEI